MRRLLIPLAVLAIGGCAITDAISRNVVARAGDHVLTVDWFAETMAEGEVLLRPDILERWAWTWVQYSLFLQAMAAGDTFVDSATVAEAMWPEVLIARVGALHEQFAATRLQIDSAQIDSAFAVGEHRVIDHILIGTASSDLASEKDEKRRRAEAIRARLAAGRSWANEVQATTDIATRTVDGRLGTIEPGQTLPEFEQVAFSLEPGELSEVTETYYGYHIIRRPTLHEVRQDFEGRIGVVLLEQWKELLLRELTERRGVRITDDGPEIMRAAADRPFRVLALEPGKVIGTYDGGSLTDVGFVRWLQAWPGEEHISVADASDEELRDMATRAVQNDILHLEAKEVGAAVPPEQYAEILVALEEKLDRLRGVLRVDSVMARANGLNERRQVAQEVLDEYFTRTAGTLRDMVIVPPFLAAKLRSERRWSFSYAGLNKGIQRAVELRAARDSTAG